MNKAEQIAELRERIAQAESAIVERIAFVERAKRLIEQLEKEAAEQELPGGVWKRLTKRIKADG